MRRAGAPACVSGAIWFSCDNPSENRVAEHTTGSGMSYAAAGVDVARGNAFVDAIKPLVRLTAQTGADGEIGGFGGVRPAARRGQ